MNRNPIITRTACTLLALACFSLPLAAATAPPQAPTLAGSEGPLTLDRCMLIALEHNPGLVSSAQGVISARAAVTAARSPYYPQLSLAASESVSGQDPEPASGDGTVTTGAADLLLSQTLWRSGLRESVAETRSRLTATEQSYYVTVQNLLVEVASNFYNVLATKALVGVAESAVDSSTRHLEEVRARIRIGVTAEVDQFTADDDLARAELALIDARGNHRLALARLKTSLGVSPESTLDLTEPPAIEEASFPDLSAALATAWEHRPDLQGAQASVAASSSALKRARINRGPLTNISADYDLAYTDWESSSRFWELGLGLSWPLFDGNATKADVIAARAAYTRSQADLQQVVNEAGLEVESALVEVERSQERVTASAKSVAAAEARLRAAEGKYQQGVGILIEVIDARAALTDAQANQVRAQYDYRVALVSLEKALGTLAAPMAEELSG